MTPFVTTGLGFLLAVLWFDLMFDVQAWRRPSSAQVSEQVVDSISSYYRRVTTGARPMNRLIAVVMAATIGALAVQVSSDDAPDWVAAASLALTLMAVAIAGARTVPSARRLGTRRDDVA